jgi:predicted TPR repeat methyltransferase
MTEKYNEDYFENGVEKRISGYTNYHFRPEYVFPIANWIKSRFCTNPVLDYGCAKGYLVKALRLLDVPAYGYDISEYAISTADDDIKDFVSTKLDFDKKFELVIAKDILEHVTKEDLPKVLSEIYTALDYYGNLLAVIPLGDNGKFRIREYEMDITHVTKEDEEFWIKEFQKAGFKCNEFYYRVDGIKDNWSQYPYGNGVFILEKI